MAKREVKHATCHPDRKHKAKGLCWPCYDKAWNEANPERKASHGIAWHKANPAWKVAYDKAYYEANRVSMAARDKVRHEWNGRKVA